MGHEEDAYAARIARNMWRMAKRRAAEISRLSKPASAKDEKVRSAYTPPDGPLAVRLEDYFNWVIDLTGCRQVFVADADDLGTVSADLKRTRQILFNLVSNACKFTEDGEVTLRAARLPYLRALASIRLSICRRALTLPSSRERS